MDGDRFDDIVRSLASGSSRRRFLKGLGLGTAAVAGGRAAGADAAPQLVRICVPGKFGKYTEIKVPASAVKLMRRLGAYIPQPGYPCNGTCVPDPVSVTCGPRPGNPYPQCRPRPNNCGVSIDCGDCGECETCHAGNCFPRTYFSCADQPYSGCDQDTCSLGYCDHGVCVQCLDDSYCEAGTYCDEGSCREGCRSDRDCVDYRNNCNDAFCEAHSCVQVPINEDVLCAPPVNACWKGSYCKAGVCTQLSPIVNGECGHCMECDGYGNCVPVSDVRDRWDHCPGMQYCWEGSCTGCSDDTACESNQICEAGTCVPGCNEDLDCAYLADDCNDALCFDHECRVTPKSEQGGFCDGGFCSGGVCVQCVSDLNCSDGLVCVASSCVPGCGTDADCAAGSSECNPTACVAGKCESHPVADGTDCYGGFCQNGSCLG